MKKIRVAILGAGFIAAIHADCYARFIPDAEVVAVYARDAKKAQAFAEQYAVPAFYTDLDELFAGTVVDIADVCLPNALHHGACLRAARAGTHVIVEKPLCLTLREADEMIAACKEAEVMLMYAEEMCFAPEYERALAIMQSGAIGKLYRIKHRGRHSGPHNRWFYEPAAGGGAMLDMGCHSIGWFLHAQRLAGHAGGIRAVYAKINTVFHDTRLDDEAVFLLDLDGRITAVGEAGWARKGACEDAMELAGTGGVIEADLYRGNAALVYSETGYDYSGEKCANTRGYSFMAYEEAFHNGYPQELTCFIDCVRKNKPAELDGAFGRQVLEAVIAAYRSASTGKTVFLPCKDCEGSPVSSWLS